MDKVCLGGYGIMPLLESIKAISQPVRYYGTVEDNKVPYRVYGTKFTDKINFYAVKA